MKPVNPAHPSASSPSRRLAATLAAFAALLAPAEAHAFDTLYHTEMTTTALNNSGVTDSAVINAINNSSMAVDIDEMYVPEAHWDRESFAGASTRMNTQLATLISDLKSGDTSDALIAFGKLFHNAQDFYSHSNWVEMSNPQAYDLFNMPVIPSSTVTCAPGAVPSGQLTTGYYPDNQTPAGKCEHAQLNKDMPDDFNLHVDFYPAYQAALNESAKLIAHVQAALAADPQTAAQAKAWWGYLTSSSAAMPKLATPMLPHGNVAQPLSVSGGPKIR